MNEAAKPPPPPEHLRYASALELGVRAGLLLLVATFVLYLAGVLQPLVPADQLAQYWGMPVGEFVKATRSPTGWTWLGMLGKADILNLAGIAVLAGSPMLATLAVVPVFARRRELPLLALSLLQLAVLALSASNWVAAR